MYCSALISLMLSNLILVTVFLNSNFYFFALVKYAFYLNLIIFPLFMMALTYFYRNKASKSTKVTFLTVASLILLVAIWSTQIEQYANKCFGRNWRRTFRRIALNKV